MRGCTRCAVQSKVPGFNTLNGLTGRILTGSQEDQPMLAAASESCCEVSELGWIVAMDEDDVQGRSVAFI